MFNRYYVKSIMKEISIELPIPISVNKAYAGNGRIRYKSREYKEYEEKVKEIMQNAKTLEIDPLKWVVAEYRFFFPLYFKNGKIRKRDVANLEKVLSDTLTHHIKGFRDENIIKLTLTKINSLDECVVVKLKTI